MPAFEAENGDASHELKLATHFLNEIRPSHLLLTPTFSTALRISDNTNFFLTSLLLLQFINAIAGAASAALLYRLFQKKIPAGPIPFILTGILAFNFAYWMHSREAESAIISQLFAVLTISFLFLQDSDKGNELTTKKVVIASFTAAISNLYSLNYAAFTVVYAIIVFLFSSRAKRWQHVIIFLFLDTTITSLVLLYFANQVLDHITLHSFLKWSTSHPGAQQFLGKPGLTGMLRSFSGLVNSIFGWSPVMAHFRYLIQHTSGLQLSASDLIKFITALTFAAWLLLSFLRIPKSSFQRKLYWSSLAGFLSVFGLNSIWLGSDPQFWLPAFPFLLLQVASSVSDNENWYARMNRFALPVVALTLFLTNIWYPVPTVILPGGRDWKKAEQYAAMTSDKDLLLFTSNWARHVSALHRANRYLPFEMPDRNSSQYLGSTVDWSLKNGRRVFLAEVTHVKTFASSNEWQTITRNSGYTQDSARTLLEAHYTLTFIQPDVFDSMLVEVTARPSNTTSN